MGTGTQTRADEFRALHARETPLLLVNVWNTTTARLAAEAGAPALGTTSFGIALDHGVRDGEVLPFDVALGIVRDIVRAVSVPVTFDLEAGHGEDARAVARSVATAIDAGVAGVNIEDSRPAEPGTLFDAREQAERIAAARSAAERAGVRLFVNARCDVYFGARVDEHRRLTEVIERASAYAAAGADGLFLPGLVDTETMAKVTAAVALPLNVMVMPGLPDLAQLAAAGVKRVSQGGASFLAAVGAMSSIARQFLAGGLQPPADTLAQGFAAVPALTA